MERAEGKLSTGPVTHVDPLTMIRKRGPQKGEEDRVRNLCVHVHANHICGHIRTRVIGRGRRKRVQCQFTPVDYLKRKRYCRPQRLRVGGGGRGSAGHPHLWTQ